MNLNKAQIRSINKKLNSNFDEELLLNNEKKEKLHISFINNLEVLIDELLDQGVKFYQINFLSSIDKIETACFEVEDTINYCMINISMIEFIYLVVEKNIISSNNFTIKGIFSTRNLTNETIIFSIKDLFNQLNENIDVKYLDGYDCIKENWKSLIKDKNYKFHRFVYFSNFYNKLYGSLAELEVTFFPECGYDLSFIENALDNNIKGISGKKNSKEKICLNLLNIFLCNNNMCLIFDGLYKKTEKSKFSYSFWDNINYLDLNIFIILIKLKEKYNMQLRKLDIQDLLLCCWEKIYEKILKKKIKYFNDIKYYEYIIEFNDGLYFIDKNYFLSFEENKLFFSELKNVGCYKYIDKSFEDCKYFKPESWLTEIRRSFLYDKAITKFSSTLGMFFNSNIVTTTDSISIIHKLDCLNDVLTVNFSVCDTLEEMNIKNLFFFEQQEDKKFLVCNFFKKNNDFIFDMTDSKKLINNVGNLIFKFNSKLTDKMLLDRVFFAKLLIYTFTFGCCERNILLQRSLDEELAQIIIYCNSIYFGENKNSFDPKKFFSEEISSDRKVL